MKRTVFVLAILLMILLVWSCSKDDAESSDKILTTHTWKCVGIGNTSNSDIADILPSDEHCYLLSFTENGDFQGTSSTNELFGKYWIKGNNIGISQLGWTEICELENGDEYLTALENIERFEIVDNQLRLYYHSDQKYLLYLAKI